MSSIWLTPAELVAIASRSLLLHQQRSIVARPNYNKSADNALDNAHLSFTVRLCHPNNLLPAIGGGVARNVNRGLPLPIHFLPSPSFSSSLLLSLSFHPLSCPLHLHFPLPSLVLNAGPLNSSFESAQP